MLNALLQRAMEVTGLHRRGAVPPQPASPQPAPAPTLASSLAAAGLDPLAWHAGLRAVPPRLYGCLPPGAAANLQARFPEQHRRVLAAAADVLAHRFEFLGSGPFVPRDPDRPARGDYQPIDWYLDPVRGLRFPRGVAHKEWDYFGMRPGNADIKYPWELGRCQAWVTLGQAWQLTGDARYGCEVRDQLDDFVEANPVGIGVNWTCTMDVALRAANWAIALGQVRDCGALDDAFWTRACAALFDHCEFIRGNLENHYEVTSNHFLSNVVGLYFAAAWFDALPAGRDWLAFCEQALETEMAVQVNADGSDYESSVPYHRLVSELFLGAARVATLRGARLSDAYAARLERMLEFLLGVLRPDGLMPQVGDADDGRLHVFDGFGRWTAQDPRHLLGPGAWHFAREDWRALLDGNGLWEAAWWGFDTRGAEPGGGALPAHHHHYPDAGIAVSRESGRYLLVSNGRVGTAGFGNHKHNDLLSFEYHAAGQAWVVDPGSGVYTSDFDTRNALRSIAAHNTLQLGDQESNEFRAEWLFRMFERAEPEHLAFEVSPEAVQYRGRHRGFRCGEEPVIHTRTLRLLRDTGALCIADALAGPGRHTLRWRFQLAPGVAVDAVEGAGASLSCAGAHLRVEGPPETRAVLDEGVYSPGYGRCLPAPRLVFECAEAAVDGTCFGFTLVPGGAAPVAGAPRATAAGGDAAGNAAHDGARAAVAALIETCRS